MERTYRKDIGSGKRYPQKELIRIVITKDKSSKIDKEGNIEGRGIYVHQDSLASVLKKRTLEKELNRRKASLAVIADLELFLKEEKKDGKKDK